METDYKVACDDGTLFKCADGEFFVYNAKKHAWVKSKAAIDYFMWDWPSVPANECTAAKYIEFLNRDGYTGFPKWLFPELYREKD